MNSESSLLLTDLYQLTMLESYQREGMDQVATFDFFVRNLPQERNFLVACGLEPLLTFLEQANFSDDELEWLAETGRFSEGFLNYLANWRFTGEIWALPEGTPFFEQTPVVRVSAPIGQAQLIESRLINLLQYSILVASKAARCALVAPGKQLVDFGMRRAHGAEAGVLAARACYLAGFAGSATVLAGCRDDIPLFGTMAHSYIQSHQDELSAFEAFVRAHPIHNTLLIDTYDTLAGAHHVVELSRRLNVPIQAVRIDSGDLAAQSRAVRQILDDGGCRDVTIFVSGNLQEQRLEALVASQAPIDGFGIGTCLATSNDVPYLECAYKLAEYAGSGRRKRSEHKASWPGRKQIWRRYDSAGRMLGDTLGLEDEAPDGKPLLRQVMVDGHLTQALPTLAQSRAYLAQQLDGLPAEQRALTCADSPYSVTISAGLQQAARQVDSVIDG